MGSTLVSWGNAEAGQSERSSPISLTGADTVGVGVPTKFPVGRVRDCTKTEPVEELGAVGKTGPAKLSNVLNEDEYGGCGLRTTAVLSNGRNGCPHEKQKLISGMIQPHPSHLYC